MFLGARHVIAKLMDYLIDWKKDHKPLEII